MPIAAPDVHVLALEGELCLAEVPDLRARIDRAIGDGGRHLVFDLAGCTLLTAAVLRVIALTETHLGAIGGSVRVRDPQPVAARVLAITGLDRLL